MLAQMKQRLGTTWANELEISISTELDNAHALTTAELALLMTYTMEVFCEQVRSENERRLEVEAPSDEARKHLETDFASKTGANQGRERERLSELHRERDPRKDPQPT